MSFVDTVLKRWAKDITQLEKAAEGELLAASLKNKQIDKLVAENVQHENEAKRAKQVVSNIRNLIAEPIVVIQTTDTTKLNTIADA